MLDGNGLGGLGLIFLKKQPALTELSLANTALDDAALAQLPKLPALQRLVLDGNDIRGAGLVHLSGRPELIDLSLAGSGLTDFWIKHLAGLANLEWLDLRRTKASAAGIAELQKALPKCQIDWDGKKDK